MKTRVERREKRGRLWKREITDRSSDKESKDEDARGVGGGETTKKLAGCCSGCVRHLKLMHCTQRTITCASLMIDNNDYIDNNTNNDDNNDDNTNITAVSGPPGVTTGKRPT